MIKLKDILQETTLPQPTEEMTKWFEERTARHIALVQSYAKKIEDAFPEYKGLVEQTKNHDASKLKEPERTPYIFISWQYRCKDIGRKFDVKNVDNLMKQATTAHIKSNRHHPEFHTSQTTDLINRNDRDKPPEVMIDGSKMNEIDIAEMCADWLAMAQEKSNTAKSWADKNVNTRWKFTDEQKEQIYKIINYFENKNNIKN